MGTHMPQGLKIALFACLGAILPWGIVAVADVPSTTFRHVGCCPPNAKNFGYFDTKWRDWPCDQRPEKVFPAALGSEVLPPPAGQVPLPLPKATVLPTKPETPGTKPEQPPAETQPAPGTPAEEGMTLPGEKMTLPGEGVPPPSKEVPAEGPAPKRTEKSTEPATPAPKKPTLDGSLPGLQPDTSPPPAAVEGPVAPLPPGSKAPSPQPQLQAPAAKAAEDAPAPKPAKQPDAKAELPADPTTMLPYQPSHVVQAAAFEPLAAVQPARVARADWTAPPATRPALQNAPQTVASPVAGLAAEPPVALAGYCPVALGEKEQWVRGNPQWSVVYAGHTFLLSGPEQQQRFMAATARYVPAFAGDDAVLAVDGNSHVAGKPQYSVFCDGKVYLFSTAETLARFHQNPRPYMAAGQ